MIFRAWTKLAMALWLAAAGAQAEAASEASDRIAVSANGSTLTDTNGGAGASVAWLHNFNTDALVGIGAEHQAISNAHWTFGSVNGSLSLGTGNQRYSLYAEAHEGAGDDGPRAFHYSIEAAGVVATYLHRLSLTLEDRQIDIDRTHGNLPKLGLAYQWTPHLLTSASYAYSVGGNLGTHLTALRVDGYGSIVNLLAGFTFGQAAPDLIILLPSAATGCPPGSTAAGCSFKSLQVRRLREGYLGFSKPLSHGRSELTLVADYLDLSGSKRATLTLSYVFHVGHAGKRR